MTNKLLTREKMQEVARAYAAMEINKADPFAYGRAFCWLLNGVYLPSDIL